MKKLQTITIKSIPHNRQKYETVGDYWKNKDGSIDYRVSIFGDEYMQLAVILHELIESFLCKKRKISWKKIDAFDIAYERARAEGKKYAPCGCKIQEEPGNDKHSPYHREHLFATKLEKMFIKELGYKWDDYDKLVESL